MNNVSKRALANRTSTVAFMLQCCVRRLSVWNVLWLNRAS